MTNPTKSMNLRKLASSAAFAFILIVGFVSAAHAAPYHDHDHGRGGHGPSFRGYSDHDWHGGHWFHGIHGGRPGNWWIVDGQYYAYPTAVGPYPPNPYGAPVVYAPPPVVEAPPPPPPGINLVLPIHIH